VLTDRVCPRWILDIEGSGNPQAGMLELAHGRVGA